MTLELSGIANRKLFGSSALHAAAQATSSGSTLTPRMLTNLALLVAFKTMGVRTIRPPNRTLKCPRAPARCSMLRSIPDRRILLLDVRFSNRPFEVKHFQTIRHCSVDVAHGLVLLFGIGTKGPCMGLLLSRSSAVQRMSSFVSFFVRSESPVSSS
jgi:hypothetical protein